MQAAMNASPMEQTAYIGLLALAVSDGLYCITALLAAVQSREQSAFHHDELVRMYAQLYGPYPQRTAPYPNCRDDDQTYEASKNI